MQTLHESELSYTQDHKLDLNGIARTLLEDVVNTVMVEQVEELEAGHTTKRVTVVAIATNTEAKRQNQTLYVQALSISVRCMKR